MQPFDVARALVSTSRLTGGYDSDVYLIRPAQSTHQVLNSRDDIVFDTHLTDLGERQAALLAESFVAGEECFSPRLLSLDLMDFNAKHSLLVGILSDTHVPYRMKQLPSVVFDALEDVDVILHAGDVDKPEALEPLRKIAPVYAVRGNIHVLDLSSGGISLPRLVELRLAGCQILVTHGYLPGLVGFWFKGRDVLLRLLGGSDKARFNGRIARRLKSLYPKADVIVFGHTHQVFVEWFGKTLLVNPGAVCPTLREQPTVARMTLGDGMPRVEIVPLGIGAGRSIPGVLS